MDTDPTGGHFRKDDADPSRRAFLFSGLVAAVTGLFGLSAIALADHEAEPDNGYGASPYGG